MATTFVELWHELVQGAKTLITTIEADIVDFEHRIIPIIEEDIVLVLSQLKDVVLNAIIDVANQIALHPEEKFGYVVTQAVMHAEANAISVGIQDVRMLVQQAYRAVGVSLPQATP